MQPAPARKASLGAAERFTGRFLNTFAEFEFWMVERLKNAVPGVKVGKPVGQRLEDLRAALKHHPEIVRVPNEVDKLLDRLQPYVQLRSLLAHGRLTALCGADETIYLFETPTPLLDDPGKVRIVLRSGEFETLRRGLWELIEAFKQQTPEAEARSSP
ncbi:MAG TPA: hypothetical protein VGC56_14350 [Allosphingosinicella sp.]